MQIQSPNPRIKKEIYRSLVLMGAENDLLGTVGSWGDSLSDEDVLSGLRSWNDAMSQQLTQRIEHYEISCPQMDCTQDGNTEISAGELSHR